MKTLILLLTLLFGQTASAQWEKIAVFAGTNQGDTLVEPVTCVYFLDLPGPPRIGFAGTASDLFKTTDGGKSWIQSWGDGSTGYNYMVTDICFMDTLIGWFSMFGYTDACYRTTDGGNSWTELLVPYPNYGAEGVHYCPGTNRLFLSMSDTGMEVSTDLGNSWRVEEPYSTYGFSFSSPTNGLVWAWFNADTTDGYLLTSDGGLTWDTVMTPSLGNEPLAIPETPICFAADGGRIIIRRSDDYGHTWRVIKDFGPNYDSNYNEIGPYGTGVIRGDTSKLFIQSDSGMYVSIDQGLTWVYDGGPAQIENIGSNFYCAKGITMAGSTTSSNAPNGINEGGGLWEENWPQAGVTENETLDSSFFYIAGPYPNPSEPSGDNVSILVHYCSIGSVITAQVYTLLGSPVGSAVTYTSDGQVWDRLEIPAPGTSGPYYIQVSVGAYGTTLSYSVY